MRRRKGGEVALFKMDGGGEGEREREKRGPEGGEALCPMVI